MKGLWGAVFIFSVMLAAGISFTLAYGNRAVSAKANPGVTAPAASNGQPLPVSGRRLRITVIPKGTTHVFWKSVQAGAIKAAQELGVDMVWQGPHVENERKQQIEVVQNAVSRGTDGVVLAPLDDTALVRPVAAAVERGIKAVIIDSALKYDNIVSFVATDNRAGGRLGAQRLAQIMGGTGRVLLLRYEEGSASTTEREEGFLEGLASAAPGIQLLSTNQYGGVTAESAFQAAQNLLNLHGAAIDGIFCPNESTAFGMLRALTTAGKAGVIKFVGFDSSEPLVKGLRDGHIQGLVVQDPMNMGYLGVKALVAALQGKPVEPRIDTGARMITPENMDEPAMRNLLSPDLAPGTP